MSAEVDLTSKDELDPEYEEALQQLTPEQIPAILEAILLIHDRPITIKKISEDIFSGLIAPDVIEEKFSILIEKYQHSFGFELCEVNHGYQLRSKPEMAPFIRRCAKVQVQRLSKGAMETLAIIAYKQPTLKEDIDQIRGSDSSHFVRMLLSRGLIEISGRSELPGRPILYSTTGQFLEIFGLKDEKSLPPLQEIENMLPGSEAGSSEDDPRLREMNRMMESLKQSAKPLRFDPRQDEEDLKKIRERIESINISTPSLEESEPHE